MGARRIEFDRGLGLDEEGRRMRMAGDAGLERARDRFGGIDPLAVLAGAITITGATVLIDGTADGIGRIAYHLSEDGAAETWSTAAFVAGLAVLGVASLVGGWTTGRIARYDGARNGFLTGLVFVLLAAAAGGLGAWLGEQYDAFLESPLPQWFSDGELEAAESIISAIAAMALCVATATLGGLLGRRYHRRADEVIAHSESQVRAERSDAALSSSDRPRAGEPAGRSDVEAERTPRANA